MSEHLNSQGFLVQKAANYDIRIALFFGYASKEDLDRISSLSKKYRRLLTVEKLAARSSNSLTDGKLYSFFKSSRFTEIEILKHAFLLEMATRN